MNRKAIIVSILGKKLSLKEKKMIKKYKPWGIILFKRNIKSISQLKELTSSIRLNMKDKHYPILIDEEGGIVSRLSDLISNKKFSQYFFGSCFFR